VPLNDIGKKEAFNVAEQLKNKDISCVYSSCLSRAVETAGTIGNALNLKPVAMKELNEMNQGVWQGLLLKGIKKRFTKKYKAWKQSPLSTNPPEGETLKDVLARSIFAINKIAEKQSGDICIVSHEIMLGCIKCYFMNLDLNTIWKQSLKSGTFEILKV